MGLVNVNVETKYIAAGLTVLCFGAALIALGYGMAESDPEVICKAHIERAVVLKNQVKTLELSSASVRQDALLACTARESGLCVGKIKEVSNRMRKLRCKICSAKEK